MLESMKLVPILKIEGIGKIYAEKVNSLVPSSYRLTFSPML
jgi:hypothetical protein